MPIVTMSIIPSEVQINFLVWGINKFHCFKVNRNNLLA
uniref:Uncharacterized protein n=1 Tax=Arundo donax TaxID=35708 RepID=A0A0A9AXF8_ARUDO